jgi:tRNA(Ile)-lysidine synthase
MDLELLKRNLRGPCGIQEDMLVVVGVSGGPDSQSLLHALAALGQPLVAAHLDHCLRPESAADARSASKAAHQLGLTFITDQRDVGKLASIAKLSIEAAARRARYEFLFKIARQHNAGGVAVAHTADDLVETVLLHLLRGSGLRGLRGLVYRNVLPEWDQRLPIIRPLLDTWRAEIEDYCREHDLETVLDESNRDTKFARNRIRHELLPNLETYNPQVKQTLWRMARSLDGDWETLQGVVGDALAACQEDAENGYVALSLPALRKMEQGPLRLVLRAALDELLPGLPNLGFDLTEQMVNYVSAPPGSRQADLTKVISLHFESEQLIIARSDCLPPMKDAPQMVNEEVLSLPVPGQVELGEGWLLTSERVTMAEADEQRRKASDDPWQAWMDADTLELPLQVHPRRSGDRFKPYGMKGRSTSLKDFYINIKLPRRARSGWPVIYSDEQTAWIPGYRIAHPYRLRAETKRVIHLRLFQPVESFRFPG